MAELSVKIPKAKDDEVVNIPKGNLGDLKSHFDRKFGQIDKLLFAVVVSVVVSVISVIVAVFGIFIDQLRYNNAAYRDYAEKTANVSDTQKINQQLMDQNQKNQQMIIDLQNKILNKN